jgi:hypothetical protein
MEAPYDTTNDTKMWLPLTACPPQPTHTVITSLITGTPLLLEQRALEAYSFLSADSVFLQENGESIVQAMRRIVELRPEEWWRKRIALAKVVLDVNMRSSIGIADLLEHLTALPASNSGKVAIIKRNTLKFYGELNTP